MKVIQIVCDFNIISVVVRIVLSMLLGGCIGMEREKSKRPAGFRTHILVCIGSCLTALIGLFVLHNLETISDPLRVSAQVISGIGFLGVGTILVKEHDRITGLTTAAGLWATAAIGIACGYGFYSGALLGTLVVTVTAAILFKFESRGRKKNRKITIYLEIKGTDYLNEYIDWLMDNYHAKSVMIVGPRTMINGNVGLEVVIPANGNADLEVILTTIREREGVLFALENMKLEK